jgi:hypothetical protein
MAPDGLVEVVYEWSLSSFFVNLNFPWQLFWPFPFFSSLFPFCSLASFLFIIVTPQGGMGGKTTWRRI